MARRVSDDEWEHTAPTRPRPPTTAGIRATPSLPTELHQIARHAERADVGEVPLKAKRGPKNHIRAETVAKIVGQVYRQLIERDPTFTTAISDSARVGQWPQFLRAIFQAMEMDDYSDFLMLKVTGEMRREATKPAVAKNPKLDN